jgi:tetratricopeptide (TPR) repeat protein
LNQRDFDAAQHLLQESIEQDSSRADLYLKLADVQAIMGSDDESALNYERALELEPACLEATVKLATCRMKSGLYAAACKHFTTAMEINDDIIDAYSGLATAQKLSGHQRQALDTLSLASAISPNSSLLFTQAAALQMHVMMTGNTDADTLAQTPIPDHSALLNAVCNELVIQMNRQPNSADGHYRVGICLMRAGEIAGAIGQFEEALKINPLFSRARTKLAVCLFDVDRKDEALETITAEISPAKDDLDLYYKTAVLFTNKSLFTRAQQNLQNFLSQNYARAESAQNISNVLQNLGLIDRASALLECLAHSVADNPE